MAKKRYIPASFLNDVITMSKKELAKKYKIGLSTAYKWEYIIKSGHETIQINFQIDSYILGILWAVGYDSGEFFFVRHRNIEILKLLQKFFLQDSKIIHGKSNTDEQWKIKIRGDARNSILTTLKSHSWTPRNSDIRFYPTGEINHVQFIKAWIEMHSYYYVRKGHLRIYGNYHLIASMNDIISRITGVGVKTPIRLHNGKTYALCYQNSIEVEKIFMFFDLK